MISRFAAGALLLAATPLAAQSNEREDVQLRNDCRLAAQIVRTGHPAPHREWAYAAITRCSDSGAAVIAEAWREPPTDERIIQELVSATAQLRNKQVFEAVAEAARNGGNDRLVRTYAFVMLHNFAHPGLSLSAHDLLRPRGDRLPRIYASSGDGGSSNAPELGDVAADVRGVLEEIVASDPDEDVVRTARAVLDRV